MRDAVSGAIALLVCMLTFWLRRRPITGVQEGPKGIDEPCISTTLQSDTGIQLVQQHKGTKTGSSIASHVDRTAHVQRPFHVCGCGYQSETAVLSAELEGAMKSPQTVLIDVRSEPTINEDVSNRGQSAQDAQTGSDGHSITNTDERSGLYNSNSNSTRSKEIADREGPDFETDSMHRSTSSSHSVPSNSTNGELRSERCSGLNTPTIVLHG